VGTIEPRRGQYVTVAQWCPRQAHPTKTTNRHSAGIHAAGTHCPTRQLVRDQTSPALSCLRGNEQDVAVAHAAPAAYELHDLASRHSHVFPDYVTFSSCGHRRVRSLSPCATRSSWLVPLRVRRVRVGRAVGCDGRNVAQFGRMLAPVSAITKVCHRPVALAVTGSRCPRCVGAGVFMQRGDGLNAPDGGGLVAFPAMCGRAGPALKPRCGLEGVSCHLGAGSLRQPC
jgi:hypothetical protein